MLKCLKLLMENLGGRGTFVFLPYLCKYYFPYQVSIVLK